MTTTNGWLSYVPLTNGAVDQNPGSDSEAKLIDASRERLSIKLPDAPGTVGYWTAALRSWCDTQGIPYDSQDGGTVVSAKVSKAQVEAFIEHIYGKDREYIDPDQIQPRTKLAAEFVELKRVVAQGMDPSATHSLSADEW